jgi:hypothetical protein
VSFLFSLLVINNFKYYLLNHLTSKTFSSENRFNFSHQLESSLVNEIGEVIMIDMKSSDQFSGVAVGLI